MNEPMTLQEIADDMGISKQMVAKIEKRALAKAKATLDRLGLSWEDFVDELRQQEEVEAAHAEFRGEAR